MPDLPTETQDTAAYGEFCRFLAKVVIQLVSPPLKESEQRAFYLSCPSDLGLFAAFASKNKWPWSYVKSIVDMHVDCNLYWPCITYEELVSLFPCEVLSDDGALNEYCQQVLTANPKSIVDYKKGKVNALNHLKGQVMKLTKGKADILKVEMILKSKMVE